MSSTAFDAYVAGFIDGEGTISITRRMGLVVRIGNTYRPILDEIATAYGGTVNTVNMLIQIREGKLNLKQQYQWMIHANEAAAVLERIRPFLREKRVQAWLGLEFQAQKTDMRGRRAGVSAEETALRNGYYLAMRNLHANSPWKVQNA